MGRGLDVGGVGLSELDVWCVGFNGVGWVWVGWAGFEWGGVGLSAVPKILSEMSTALPSSKST